MGRELKFRAFNLGKMESWSEIKEYNLSNVFEMILMQFTGLKDKNGREIYEGDVLRNGMRVGDSSGWTNEKVVRGEFGEWLLADLKTGEKGQMQRNVQLREIIGNIYENLALLKGGEDK